MVSPTLGQGNPKKKQDYIILFNLLFFNRAGTHNPNVDMSAMLEKYTDDRYVKHSHRALDDAKEQGARFVKMLREKQ